MTLPHRRKNFSHPRVLDMDRQTWNQFILEHGPRSGRFLQSWEWGTFQQAVGETVRRETFEEHGKLVGLAQWVDRRATRFFRYAYCPKGRVGAWQPRPDSSIFLRVEPSVLQGSVQARKSIDLSPAHTRVTDLMMTEDTLLDDMHSKTRYNIRVAQKHAVHVEINSTNFSSAWDLFEQTASRGQFRLHARGYYEKMLASLSGDCRTFLATASHEGKLLAANIMIDFGDTRTYLHGASSNAHRELMAPYLLHWELLRDAKEHGLAFYDWWGVAPEGAPDDHPWTGISRFKRGFPGVEYASPGTYDLVLQPLPYNLYQLGRSLIRIVRRYV